MQGMVLLTTATALEDKSSWGDMAVKYAMLVNVYTNVTNGMDMNMARGRFLIKESGGQMRNYSHAQQEH